VTGATDAGPPAGATEDRTAATPLRCAFLTSGERHDFVVDDDRVRDPLRALGWELHSIPWDREGVAWDDFDLVVVRSTWDYHRKIAAFEGTLERIDRSGARLANPLELIRWNARKGYLLDLEARGVPMVPTVCRPRLTPGELEALRDKLGAEELVVKPEVGASGRDVFRAGAADGTPDAAVESAFRERAALVQPFLPAVLNEGEVSVVLLAGGVSHAILKRPGDGGFLTQEERGATLEPHEPDPAARTLARRTLGAVDHETLYARVDIIRDPSGRWRVVELELIEPSLYFRVVPAAAGRFARAVDRWHGRVVEGPGRA